MNCPLSVNFNLHLDIIPVHNLVNFNTQIFVRRRCKKIRHSPTEVKNPPWKILRQRATNGHV